MIYILYDQPYINEEFISKYLDQPNRVINSPNCKHKIISWVKGAWLSLKRSRYADTIICWYDFQAIICYWICKLLFLKRRIICINLLLKDKSTIKNRIVSFLYKVALKDRQFTATVTSVEYGKWLNKKLGIEREFYLLHDVYKEEYNQHYNGTVEKNSVFCGGRNGRDWAFMLKLAKLMPNIKFNLVMPGNVFQKHQFDFSSNIVARHDLNTDDFYQVLCKSEIVCLPLNTEAPAGLIVMFQAAANDKIIISTDTVTTREYLSEGRGILCDNDFPAWKNAITIAFFESV